MVSKKWKMSKAKVLIANANKVSFQRERTFWISRFSLRKSVPASFCPYHFPRYLVNCLSMQDTEQDAWIESYHESSNMEDYKRTTGR